MRPQPRMEQYHRRRQHVARRRRGAGRSRHRRSLSAALQADRLDNGLDVHLRDILWEVLDRICTYRAVTGLFLLSEENRIILQVVAKRPMTELLRVLANTWEDTLRETDPGIDWDLRVSDHPPSSPPHYRCLYWRDL